MLIKHFPPPKTTQRQSGVELLRIISIFLICISHSVQTLEKFVDFHSATTDPQLLTLQLLRFCGTIGNILFVICSSYFLVNSKKAKAEKAMKILLDSSLISIGILCCFIIGCEVFDKKYSFTFITLLSNIFPDMYNQVWFVPTYILFYMIHPYLNAFIASLKKKEHFLICFFIFIFYGIGSLFSAAPAYSNIIGFISIYFIISYLRKYNAALHFNKKINVIIFVCEVFLFVLCILLKNIMSIRYSFFEGFPNLDGMCSVVFLPMLISLFNLFLSMDFSSRLINTVASCSLFIYCIHENAILRSEVRPKYYEFVFTRFGDGNALFFALLCAMGMFVGSLLLALIYKYTFHKITEKLGRKLRNSFNNLFDRLFKQIL